MFNNFIGGGQVFLHKVRMFLQVFSRTVHIALLIGIIGAISFNIKDISSTDWYGFISYQKAGLSYSFDTAINKIRPLVGQRPTHITLVDAKTAVIIWRNQDPISILKSSLFKKKNHLALQVIKTVALFMLAISSLVFLIIFLLWSKFGELLKTEKTIETSNKLLSPKEICNILKRLGKASDLTIGDIPLVKDKETQHFLVTGATGSGKTNLIHNLLPQIERKNQPAVIIDQTGEMIAKYYNKERGDIIFNPFDQRGKAWNFWADCSSREELERFSKILIGFNQKQADIRSDPFWNISAETVFSACVEYLRPKKVSIQTLVNMVCNSDVKLLKTLLTDTEAERYLGGGSTQTAASIAAVLSSSAKPLTYLPEIEETDSFSMKEHFTKIAQGHNSWLFLASKPSSRSLTLPLISSLTELALSNLIDIGIDLERRVWFVMDELPSLGKLPALSTLMPEGRKYGACVVAGVQSLNQLYSSYGRYDGSTIFGQFGTLFFFQNKEPEITSTISTMCGMKTITRNQKNTSFGAHEFRDGVSYNEHQQKEAIIKKEDIASLRAGECYVLLPEPQARLSKLQVPIITLPNKNEALIPKEISYITHNAPLENIPAIEDTETDNEEGNDNISPVDKNMESIFALDK